MLESTSSSEVEERTSRIEILKVVLRVERLEVTRDGRMQVLNIIEPERLHSSVHVGNERFYGRVVESIELSSCLGRDNLVDQVPGHVFADEVHTVKVNHGSESGMGTGVLHGCELGEGGFEHVAFTEGLGEGLNLIRDLELPDVEERLTLLEHLLLHELLHRFDLGLLPIVDQVGESPLVGNALHRGDLSFRALSHLGHSVGLFLHV